MLSMNSERRLSGAACCSCLPSSASSELRASLARLRHALPETTLITWLGLGFGLGLRFGFGFGLGLGLGLGLEGWG